MTCSDEQKVITAMLKVDLECYQCYRKVKRSICRFPQIRNQVYDEKQNIVTITVVCCNPERVIEKLSSKAGKSIKGTHIVKPQPPPSKKPDSDPPKPASSEPEKPKSKPPAPAPEPEKPKPKPAPEAKPPAPAPEDKPAVKKNGSKNGSKSEPAPAPAAAPKEAAAEKPAPAPAPAPAPTPAPAQAYTEPVAQWVPGYPPGPPPQVFPVAMYCTPGYEQGGYGPGPGYYQYGRPQCPPGYYGNRCDYFSEENPTACSIM